MLDKKNHSLFFVEAQKTYSVSALLLAKYSRSQLEDTNSNKHTTISEMRSNNYMACKNSQEGPQECCSFWEVSNTGRIVTLFFLVE